MEGAPDVRWRREALAWVIKELGVPLASLKGEVASDSAEDGNFLSRFMVQKAVFLLSNLLGAPLNYNFDLYISGPYSTELASDYYSMTPDELDKLAAEAEGFMGRYRGAVKAIKEARPEVLELAAMLLDFLLAARDEPHILGGKMPEELVKALRPWATDELIKEAQDLLDRIAHAEP